MDINKIFRNEGLINGRMLSFSKSQYREENPNSIVYFNANIITINDGKIWYGDLDLTKDGETLKRISTELEQTIYVLRELDCRFEDELKPTTELVSKSVWDTTLEIPFK